MTIKPAVKPSEYIEEKISFSQLWLEYLKLSINMLSSVSIRKSHIRYDIFRHVA